MERDGSDRRRVTRRRLLWGGAAAGVAGLTGLTAVELEVLPGKALLYHHLGHDGTDGVVPDVEPGRLDFASFSSRARGAEVGWALARPPGLPPARGSLPVVVALHGRGQDHTSAFRRDRLALDSFLADAVAQGVPPFAIASIDGGESYWHDRADGDRAQTMVVDELLPRLADAGLDTRRIGLVGWSMGGFGALHLGALLGPDRVAAVSALSPALWHEYDDTAPGAYDDAADFDRVSVMGRQDELEGIAVRVDCGKGDPFYATTRDYVAGFADPPAGGFQLGDHDSGYWRRLAPRVLRFLGRALAS
ncbi:MAG TPA: alpha/beta hydrolase-fold protein [Nocardioides sp.]|nr:alpha/beta hydrolase-fold protein [Nocardioides sp.]